MNKYLKDLSVELIMINVCLDHKSAMNCPELPSQPSAFYDIVVLTLFEKHYQVFIITGNSITCIHNFVIVILSGIRAG